MRKLRIGIWLLDNYAAEVGGAFSYYTYLVELISKTDFKNAEICFLGNHMRNSNIIGKYNYVQIKKSTIKSKLSRFFIQINKLLLIFDLNIFHSLLLRWDRKQNLILSNYCDVIYYLLPICPYPNFPFIYTIFDLGHLTSFSFPEVNNDTRFEKRNEYNNTIPFKALMVLCESKAGKNDIIKFLKLNEARIKVFPLFCSKLAENEIVPEKPTTIEDNFSYFHYPAQFWAHKNHYNLILAYNKFRIKYPYIKLIFTGSDHGNLPYIKQIISQHNLERDILILGFLSINQLKWLYINSKGLIMPTLLGPTNIPPLEALALGCPIAVSDFDGHREQLGNNAIYFNPLNVDDIVSAMEKLLIAKRIINSNKQIMPRMDVLDELFAELKIIRHTWE